MIQTHALRTWPSLFQAVLGGDKTFEVRKNDRNFKLGDTLLLQEWDPDTLEYTGASCPVIVTYILDGWIHEKQIPGWPDCWVVMGVEKLND